MLRLFKELRTYQRHHEVQVAENDVRQAEVEQRRPHTLLCAENPVVACTQRKWGRNGIGYMAPREERGFDLVEMCADKKYYYEAQGVIGQGRQKREHTEDKPDQTNQLQHGFDPVCVKGSGAREWVSGRRSMLVRTGRRDGQERKWEKAE